jgi:hypothetical protein
MLPTGEGWCEAMPELPGSLNLWKHRFRRAVVWVMNFWSDHPTFDMLLVVTLIGTHLLIVYRFDSGNVLHWTNQSQRLAVYAAGAGTMSLIAGFTGTAIAQYGSSSGPIVTALRSTHGAAIRRNWLNISAWLLAGTVLCVIAMAIDATKSPRGSEWMFEVALAIAVLKFVRLMFLFGLILSSIDSEVERPTRKRRSIGLRTNPE